MESLAAKLANDIPMYEAKDEGHMSAAEDVLKAIKSGDSKALHSALKAHWEMCEASEYKE